MNKNIFIFAILLLLTIKITVAQPRNYWTTSFNSEASLLAGAVVGGNSDITSIYYNPAGISEIKDQKFALNANLFNLSYTTYKNSLGTGINSNYLGFTVQPRFISFIFKSPNTDKLTWQCAIFNRNDNSISVYDQIEKPVKLIHPQFQENYTGNFDFTNEYTDSWGGIGVAYKISDNLILGGSVLFSFKDFDYMNLININVQSVDEMLPDIIEPYSAYSSIYDKVVMYDVRAMAKIGVRYKYNRFGFGLNMSLPSIRIMGNSDVKRTVSSTGLYDEGFKVEDHYYNESALYLKSEFKDPFSISAGVVYKNLSNVQFYFTTEYFHKIDTYKAVDGTLVDDDDYKPATDFLSYKIGAKSIMNFALGCQFNTSEKFEILLGFRTNFDPYYIPNADKNTIIQEFKNPSADLYHITGGSKFTYKKLSVIAGLEYITGKQKGLKEFVNFAEPQVITNDYFTLAGETNNNMTYIYNAVGLYFGFTFGF